MEMKYLTAMVIGLILLIALFAFFNPKVDLAKDITNNNIKIQNPACYAECAMKISKDGGSYENCIKTDCTTAP